MRFIIALLGAVFIAATAHAQSEYQIRPGDQLRIEVLEDANLNRDALVLPDGRISVPMAGTIQAGGRTVDQVRSDIAQRLAPNFAASPTVFVGISAVSAPRATGRGRSIDVYVVGEVANPGKLEVDRGTTVLQLFAEMGGFSNFAATKRVQLHRADRSGNDRVYVINYHALERGASAQGVGTVLADGDVIIVPQRRLFE